MGRILLLCHMSIRLQMVGSSHCYSMAFFFCNILQDANPSSSYLGIVSGTVGGMGNLGGIVFAIIFRYNGSHYARSLWIIGVICIAGNMAVSWVHPLSRRKPRFQSNKCIVVSG